MVILGIQHRSGSDVEACPGAGAALGALASKFLKRCSGRALNGGARDTLKARGNATGTRRSVGYSISNALMYFAARFKEL